MFLGAYDQVLENTIRIFDTLDEMCMINEEEKIYTMPVMNKYNALYIFSQKDRHWKIIIKKGSCLDHSKHVLRNSEV